MGVLRLKPGAEFRRLDASGFRILGTLDRIARELPYDLTVTCGSDSHPPSDPHTLGRAVDVRTHDLTDEQKLHVLKAVILDLSVSGLDAPTELPLDVRNQATRFFFGQLENQGDSSEHLHFQQRKGVNYPPSAEILRALNA
jgi:hypothetical protein